MYIVYPIFVWGVCCVSIDLWQVMDEGVSDILLWGTDSILSESDTPAKSRVLVHRTKIEFILSALVFLFYPFISFARTEGFTSYDG